MKLFLISGLVAGYLLLATGTDGDSSSWTEMKECKRKCDGEKRTCYLQLTIERYTVLGPACRNCENGTLSDCFAPQCITADGFHRAIITANRRIPGPAIEVCQNDTVVVDVKNQMPDHSTTIHWHGIKQLGSPWADGVPYVTQCPILPGTTFRYAFVVEATGTYFYHSHMGLQKIDGLNGALIVRGIKQDDMFNDLYDVDNHTMLIQDWTHVPGEHLLPGLHNEINQFPITYLINGRGAHYIPNNNFSIPVEEFIVEPGKRYRFKIIGSVCTVCAVAVTFENHKVIAISADGDLKFKPVPVDTVVLNSADRYDVILHANQTPGVYYIRLMGYGPEDCNATQYAVLRYAGSKEELKAVQQPITNFGTILNDVRSQCDNTSTTGICFSNLKGVTNAPEVTDLENYHQFHIALGFNFPSVESLFQEGQYIPYDEPVMNTITKALVNNNSFVFPPSPMLSQFDDIPEESFCSEKCPEPMCNCTYYLTVPKHSIVDIIISHRDPQFAHPFHLHGFNFYVLHMGSDSSDSFIAELKKKLRSGDINTTSRAMRDTVSTPVGGSSAIRFTALNPGYWLFHCHFNYHLDSGMAGVIKVGETDELINPLPGNFPKCGNFLPDLDI